MVESLTKDVTTQMPCGCYWIDTVLGLIVHVCPTHEAEVLGTIRGHATEDDQG